MRKWCYTNSGQIRWRYKLVPYPDNASRPPLERGATVEREVEERYWVKEHGHAKAKYRPVAVSP